MYYLRRYHYKPIVYTCQDKYGEEMIIPHETIPEMYYATYPDGTLSADFYNISRAKDHTAVLLETTTRQDARQSLLEAH